MQTQDKPESTQALFMKPTEPAQILDVSVRTITRMCDAGQLPAVKLRGTWRINRAEFMRTIGMQAQA